MQPRIQVQTTDFELSEEYQRLRDNPACGAVVTFTGLVRELVQGNLTGMTLEHYPGMTESALTDICQQAAQRWELGAITVIHRVGSLGLNDQIVFVGVAAAHRQAAFMAAEFIMDYLKTRAPFWKQEHTTAGSYWVDAKTKDQLAAARWHTSEAEG